MSAAITLYGSFLSGATYRVGLMLALTGTPFTYRHIDLSKGQHKTPEFLKLSRWGQVPALIHDGQALVQSNVIIDYLANLTGKFGGADATERRHAREWLLWEADRLSPGVNRSRFFARFMKPDPAVQDFFRNLADMGLKSLDDLIAGRAFLVGDGPTIADIGVWGNLVHHAEGGIDLAPYPNVTAWAGRVKALPGYQAPYDLLPTADRD
jgi:glutathione S-transferase